MKLLAIDTSTTLATVALTLGHEVFCAEQDNLRQHAQFLLPMIDKLLIEANVGLNQLDGIVFGCGPGSFTGLRITCSIAKALAYAHDLPLFPVSSLDAIADEVGQIESGFDKNTGVFAVLDARMHQLYWRYFGKNGMPEAQVSSPMDIVLPTDAPVILAGVGFESYIAQLPPSLQDRLVMQQEVFPHARAMLRLVQLNQIQPVSAAEALPVYVRNQVTQGEARG